MSKPRVEEHEKVGEDTLVHKSYQNAIEVQIILKQLFKAMHFCMYCCKMIITDISSV